MQGWGRFKYRSLWQHPLWGEVMKQNGRPIWIIEKEGALALVIKNTLPFGLSWLEVPRGPLYKSEEALKGVMKDITSLAQKEKAVFVRFSSYQELPLKEFNLRHSSFDHHPETSLVINLDQTEEAILAQMKSKGRYNIKVAEKHEVHVEPSDDMDMFYQLLSKTGNRDGFGVHPKAYYKNMLSNLGQHGQLLLAYYQDRVIAGGLFVYLDDWGIYYYGASDYHYRNVMAPYLVQWHAILEAKKRGCKHYDFLGIAPEGATKHAWLGVTEFKKKFGGRVVTYPHAKELVLRRFWYFVYKLRKRLA